MLGRGDMQSDHSSAVRTPVVLRWAWLNWPVKGRWGLTFVFWMVMNVFLFMPAKAMPEVSLFPLQDKVAHLAMFGVLGVLVRWSIPDGWGRGWRRWVVGAILMGYGIGSEGMQALIPGAARLYEVGDIVMDCAGSVAGLYIGGWLAGRWRV